MVNTQNINIYIYIYIFFFLGGGGGGGVNKCLLSHVWEHDKKLAYGLPFLGNSQRAVETRQPGNVNYRQKFYKLLSSSAKTANEL